MKTDELYSKILGCGIATYYNWKREDNRPMMKILNKYFSNDDLIEFLTSEEILKFKLVEDFSEKQKDMNFYIIELVKKLSNSQHSYNDSALDYLKKEQHKPYLDPFIDYIMAYDDISNETYSHFLVKTSENVHEEIIDILLYIRKVISEMDEDTKLQFKILKKNNFKPLYTMALLKDNKDFLLDFWIKVISKKEHILYSQIVKEIKKGEDFDKLIQNIKKHKLGLREVLNQQEKQKKQEQNINKIVIKP